MVTGAQDEFVLLMSMTEDNPEEHNSDRSADGLTDDGVGSDTGEDSDRVAPRQSVCHTMLPKQLLDLSISQDVRLCWYVCSPLRPFVAHYHLSAARQRSLRDIQEDCGYSCTGERH